MPGTLKPARAHPRIAGFTLVEMLVVMAIMSILIVFAVLSVRGIGDSQKLTTAASVVQAQIEGARQFATSRNRPVELRLYQYQDNESPGAAEEFQALQLFTIGPFGKLSPAGRIERLPAPMRLSTDVAFSSLLDPSASPVRTAKDPASDPTSADQPVAASSATPGDENDRFNYKYVSIRFRADGSFALDPARLWFVTVEDPREAAEAGKARGKSITIQIDPVNGVVRSLRPG